MRRWGWAVGAAAVGIVVGGLALAWQWRGPARPNVLIVLWDTARADRMSVYGYPKPTTPRLEAFAAEGVVYENATAPGMWTLASHASMFTGLYETSHGAKPAYRWLDDRYTTLAETLRGSGYDTFMFSSNLIASPMTHLDQGFDTVHTSFPRDGTPNGRYQKDARQATRRKVLPNDASTELSPAFAGSKTDLWEKAVFKDAAPVAHQALIDWLDERPDDKPFLAYLNLMEAHTPRFPSLSARERVSDAATIATALRTDTSLFAANEFITGNREYTPEELEAIGATYDATLVDLDDATGDLIDDLRARGVLDDTVVVVVADHGEGLGEHRRLEHRWSVYDALLHVPLIVRYPPAFAPARVRERVSTIDLYATLVDLAGATPPGAVFSTSLRGRTTWDRHVFSQMLDPFASQLESVHEAHPAADLREWAKTYCVVYEGMTKLIYASDGAHELYDLAADPGELRNRYPEGAAPLEAALAAFEGELTPYDPAARAPTDGPKGGASAEERERLRILGYVQDDEPPRHSIDFCGPRAAQTREPEQR
ncbi:MAG: sulfatase [Myxococcota bacterium]